MRKRERIRERERKEERVSNGCRLGKEYKKEVKKERKTEREREREGGSVSPCRYATHKAGDIVETSLTEPRKYISWLSFYTYLKER